MDARRAGDKGKTPGIVTALAPQIDRKRDVFVLERAFQSIFCEKSH
jgi:hypothetical protein